MLLTLVLGVLFGVLLHVCEASDRYVQTAHLRAETVLCADFIAKYNAWIFDQGQRGADHFEKYDAREQRQLDEIRKAWRAFDEEMKHAGY